MLALSEAFLQVRSFDAGGMHVQMLGAKPTREGSNSEGREHGQTEDTAGGAAAGKAQQETSSPKVGDAVFAIGS